MRNPGGAEFADKDPDVREAPEKVVEDQRGERIGNRPLTIGVLPLPSGELERWAHLPTPVRCHLLLVVEFRDVVANHSFRFVDARPEGIEVRVAGAASISWTGRKVDEVCP